MELRRQLAAAALPIAVLVYLCFVAAVGWSALRYRRQGWVSGLFLAILLGSLPVWVAGFIRLYEWLVE